MRPFWHGTGALVKSGVLFYSELGGHCEHSCAIEIGNVSSIGEEEPCMSCTITEDPI